MAAPQHFGSSARATVGIQRPGSDTTQFRWTDVMLQAVGKHHIAGVPFMTRLQDPSICSKARDSIAHSITEAFQYCWKEMLL